MDGNFNYPSPKRQAFPATASKIITPGRIVLATKESIDTMELKWRIGAENTEELRRKHGQPELTPDKLMD